MPDHNETATPFDAALQLAERAVLAQLDQAEQDRAEGGCLSAGRWQAIRADFDTYRQLVHDRHRWLQQGRG